MIAPRGELSAGALSLKARKKRYFLAAWTRFLRSMDIIWHASSEMEASDIREKFPSATIEVREDQSDLPHLPYKPLVRHGDPAFVFISRISRMKNLDLTLRAFGALAVPATLDVFGPIEDVAYWSECQKIICELPARLTVRYRGELHPSTVREKFAEYDAFIFPTKGENFGHVIPEALSASCPVICSANTQWTALLECGGGMAIRELSPREFGNAITDIAESSPEERLMARRAAGAAYLSWRRPLKTLILLIKSYHDDPWQLGLSRLIHSASDGIERAYVLTISLGSRDRLASRAINRFRLLRGWLTGSVGTARCCLREQAAEAFASTILTSILKGLPPDGSYGVGR